MLNKEGIRKFNGVVRYAEKDVFGMTGYPRDHAAGYYQGILDGIASGLPMGEKPTYEQLQGYAIAIQAIIEKQIFADEKRG